MIIQGGYLLDLLEDGADDPGNIEFSSALSPRISTN